MHASIASFYLILLILIAFKFACNAFSSNLRSLPGPFLAKFTSLYRVLLLCDGRGPQRIKRLHRTYGPILRIGPRHVYVCDPTIVPAVYGDGDRFRKVLPNITWSYDKPRRC